MSTEALGRFGHHTDPAIDFCIEVDEIEALAWDAINAIRDCGSECVHRLAAAIEFRVGGDQSAVDAKGRLHEIERLVSGAAAMSASQ